ncbi:cobyrinate a,c-diamide synthase [Microlunatus endophyticus]|uniref:cobyrinate a,c-diamide synthase n=1 Tax=Microlunatus endophyticus TaxID=1716077 RepID=UPI001E379B1B|nr:cobyrinate a,c-diamide synthase [Microlunatus endophyticus]
MTSQLSVPAPPRIVVSAPGSGQGKTTIATGLMAALRHRGEQVAGFKIGPDYIDPGYHSLATGRPGRNLDPRLCSEELMLPLLLHGSRSPGPADVAVIEGVMGLYDGQLGTDGYASTAHVARLLQAPVIIVLDVSGVSRTAAALVRGLIAEDARLSIAGVIMNKVGSPRHAGEIRRALDDHGIVTLGAVPRDRGVSVPSRHLGLMPAAERPDAVDVIGRLADELADSVDLDAVLTAARNAPVIAGTPWDPTTVVRPASDERPVVAIAGGRAFTFRYAETEELLSAAGCRPVSFDPAEDIALPADTAGIYLGGGFPEVHAESLARNAPLRDAIADAVGRGVPTVAECAGLLYLAKSCDDQPMVGVLPTDGVMTERLTLGYRTGVADHDQLLAGAGETVTGHEFHRTAVTPDGSTPPAWLLGGRPEGFSLDPAGTGTPTVHASYLHIHWAGHPTVAQRFADAAHRYRQRVGQHAYDLDHHGDRDIADGLVDLAVNVRLGAPPAWLATILRDSIDHLAGYPRIDAATQAIAAAHGADIDQVLPTAGGAEGFTLIARGVRGDHPLVVHPQFTEPEAALRAAGRRPRRLVLSEADGFVLDPSAVDDHANLIMIGNPTNPTGVLHPADQIRALVRPGRVVCVDEAFMDAVPGERESLLGGDLTGIVVLRSLTKTWGLAGLRAGYAVGDPAIIADLRRQQAPWSVSTPAADAIVACLSAQARAEAARAAEEFDRLRTPLVSGLRDLGLSVLGDPATPFVLVDCAGWPGRPGWLRLALRDHGVAARRGDTFPGLGPDWIRVAVRDPGTTRGFLSTLADIKAGAVNHQEIPA